MNKCLVTKLKASINDPSVFRIGEMRMRLNKVEQPTEHTQGFGLNVVKPVQLEIIGDGYFTDKTLTQNLGKTQEISPSSAGVWVSNGAEFAILDKYSISYISYFYSGENDADAYMRNIYINISDLKYSTSLTYLNLPNTQAIGDIGELEGLSKLNYLKLSNTKVSGDIGGLKNCTDITYLEAPNTKVSGDIGGLKNCTRISLLSLSNTKVSGDIGGLKTLTAISYLSLSNTKVSGDISQLSALTKAAEIRCSGCNLTGDIATLSALCRFVSLSRGDSAFTWSTRPSSAKIIAIAGDAVLNNVDKMLQDQAQCAVGFAAYEGIEYKTISVTGNRTSASDAAVATLQQKGYTIRIVN